MNVKREPDAPNTVYLCRVDYAPYGKRWFIFDVERHMRGLQDEPRAVLLARWIATHGRPPKLVRFGGIMRAAELGATMADVRLPIEKGSDE